jgi:Holliday junction resolvasome RuvABC endonuclease subunit
MNRKHSNQFRVLAITPSTRGFGFAVLDGERTLVDWGVKTVKGKEKNPEALAKAEKLIAQYLPDTIVMEDHATEGSRRSERVKALSQQIIALAARRKVKVKLFTHKQIRRVFFGVEAGTKHSLASIIAKVLPDELGDRLPPVRRAWMSEDSRMDIFDAVALALVLRLKSKVKAVKLNDEALRN